MGSKMNQLQWYTVREMGEEENQILYFQIHLTLGCTNHYLKMQHFYGWDWLSVETLLRLV